MQREYLGSTKNGFKVYIDPERSHAITHFAHQPKLREAVEKIIPTLEDGPEMIRIEQNMGEVIGTTDLIETTDHDEIVYAMRPRRMVYSRFVKNKQPRPFSWITLAMRKTKNNEYAVYTAFVGRNTPSFPGGNYLPEQSKDFWSNHALVYEVQDIEPGSETSVCPWD